MKAKVFEIIEKVDLQPLVFAGLIKPSIPRWRDVYIYYRNEVCNNQGLKDCIMMSANNTAEKFRINDRTVFRIVKLMEKELDKGDLFL